jgi:SAM-dependent methyltransferase
VANVERPYLQSHPGEAAYCVTASDHKSSGFPVPPRELWVGLYGGDVQGYLACGKRDVADMARILEKSGASLAHAKRVLELGCATGRMLRHLPEFAPTAELWGVDISARHIQWCVENLRPAMQFATITTVPHLPFEDRYFDLVFCGSVFTHIEDTQQSWLLELARILRSSGRLYITIHDEHTVQLLETSCRDQQLAQFVREQPVYTSNKDNFNMIVIGRGASSQVFYDSRYFCETIVPSCLRFLSYTPGAYFYQSAVLLEKLSS